MILESLDGGQNFVINITVQRNGKLVILIIEDHLPTKRLWNASVLAFGCETNKVVDRVELSKLYT